MSGQHMQRRKRHPFQKALSPCHLGSDWKGHPITGPGRWAVHRRQRGTFLMYRHVCREMTAGTHPITLVVC